jgi:ribosome biogenesis GTPase A
MAKAKRQIAEVMPKIDVVIEVLDARLPVAFTCVQCEPDAGKAPWTKTLYQGSQQE